MVDFDDVLKFVGVFHGLQEYGELSFDHVYLKVILQVVDQEE
jgi:hypothetical protein